MASWRPVLEKGDYNLAVRAMQNGVARALRVWNLPTINSRNGAYGKNTIIDVGRFKKHENLVSPPHNIINPNIFGTAAWTAVEPHLTSVERGWIAKYHAQLIAAQKAASEGGVRQRIADAAIRAYNNRARYVYHQIRPMASSLFVPAAYDRTDCSAFVTLCFKDADAADPNRRGYDGYGFTGTLWVHGSRVATPKVGDLAFYGWSTSYSAPTHVAVYIGGSEVISFGSTPIKRLPLRYRGDYQGCRSYI